MDAQTVQVDYHHLSKEELELLRSGRYTIKLTMRCDCEAVSTSLRLLPLTEDTNA